MRNRTTALLIIFVVAIAGVCTASSQSKPNLNGTWKMNREKSKFTGDGPQTVVIKFELKDASLHEWFTIGASQGERTIDLTYKMDGSQNAAQVEGRDIKTMAKWEGDSLLIVITDPEGGTFSRKFTMAEGGKTMTIAVRQSGPNGDKDDTVFLEKQ